MTTFAPYLWNCDRADLGGGVRATRFGVKWCNFLDADELWKPIVAAFEQRGGVFALSNAPYSAECPALANGESRFDYTNRYDIWTKTIRHDPAKGVTKRYIDSLPVAGILTAAGVLYPLALPHLNADILVQPHENKLRHLVQFYAEPPGTGDVVIPIDVDIDGLPPVRRVGNEVHEFRPDEWHDCDHGVSFASGTFRGVKLKKAWFWDSAGKRIAIQLRAIKRGRHVTLEKVIPRSAFIGAVYPAWTDTTSTFYPDPNVETTSCDGETNCTATDEAFATIRAANGTSVRDDQVDYYLAWMLGGTMAGYDGFKRGLTIWDTSALPDTDSISAATASWWVLVLSDSAAVQSICVVEGFSTFSTGLSSTDYEGNLASNTEWASRVLLSDITPSQYSNFALNATGLAGVNKTGVTKICTRLSGDLDNSDPGISPGGLDGVSASGAEETGTTQDPKLVVTHAAAATAKNTRSNPLGVMLGMHRRMPL